MATVNEDLLDAAIRHEVGLRRYTTGTNRKIIALLNRVNERLERQIRKIDPLEVKGRFQQKRLQKLIESVRTVMTEAYKNVNAGVRKETRGLAVYEAEFQTDMLNRVIPVKVDVITPARQQLYAAVNSRPFQGRLLKDWGSDLTRQGIKRVQDTIRMGYVEGRSTDEIVRDVIGVKSKNFKDGVMEVNRRGTEAMVRTALNHTATTAREQVYLENSDVVKGVQWVSTLDGRTSAVCRGRDGKVYDPGKGPRPPAHINCRSTTVAVTKSLREMGISTKDVPPGTRASMNGQVAADQDYSTWMRKQDVTFQDETLGKKKAQLFRRGKIDLDRFIDKAGNEYTLAELRVREAAAWEKAFGR